MIESDFESTGVVIVGAGPSGLVSALLLARLGIRSVVIERNPHTDQHPKAHELNARSIEILHDLGIPLEELAAEASPIEDASRVLFCRSINEELGRIDLMADPQRKTKYQQHLRQSLPYLNLSQSEFEKILVARAESSPLIQLRFGHRWQSLEQCDEHVISKIARDGVEYSIQSDYLLGCDGASSRVRKAIEVDVDGPANIQSFVNAYFQMNLRDKVDTPAKLYWIIHPKYAGSFIAHHVEKRWVYVVPIFQPWEQPEDYTSEILRDRIQGALGIDVPDLEITSISTWHMTAQVAQKFRVGRTFLVGDAAHRFPPTGGLGMNTGIADAHNLCWKLGFVLAGKAGAGLLDSYQQERKPVAETNCAESLENYDNIFEVLARLGLSKNGLQLFARITNSRPMKFLPTKLRQGIIHLATRLPNWLVGRGLIPGKTRDQVAVAIEHQTKHFDRLGLDIGYVYESRAVIADHSKQAKPENYVSDYAPSTEPGARLPHFWIDRDPQRCSSHDALDYERFVLFRPATATPSIELPPCDVDLVDTSDFEFDLLPPDQALLVRPDGHVAWRGAIESCEPTHLTETLNSILCRASK